MARSYTPMPRSAGNRHGRRRRILVASQRAFTLLELLIVIGIVAILASLAGPSFREFIIQQRIRVAAYDLMADLIFARSEAVKRNTVVTISKTNLSGPWTGGWRVKDSADTVLREHGLIPATVAITMESASISFSRNGRASPAASFTIDDAGGSAAIAPRYVCVDQSGGPRSRTESCT